MREQIRDVMDELDLEDITRRTAIDKLTALFSEQGSDKEGVKDLIQGYMDRESEHYKHINVWMKKAQDLERKLENAIFIDCDACGKPLTELGGIGLSPPDSNSMTKKTHLCISCYTLPQPQQKGE